MNRHLHALSLLVLMIVIAVSVLGILAVSTAASDLRIAERQAAYADSCAELNNRAQRWLSSLSESVSGASGSEDFGALQAFEKSGEYYIQAGFSDGEGHMLNVEVMLQEGSCTITEWTFTTEWDGDAPIGNLYNPDK